MRTEQKINRMLSNFSSSGMITKERLKLLLLQLAAWQEKHILEKLSKFELLSNGDIEDIANKTQDPTFVFTDGFIKRFKESLEKE